MYDANRRVQYINLGIWGRNFELFFYLTSPDIPAAKISREYETVLQIGL